MKCQDITINKWQTNQSSIRKYFLIFDSLQKKLYFLVSVLPVIIGNIAVSKVKKKLFLSEKANWRQEKSKTPLKRIIR